MHMTMQPLLKICHPKKKSTHNYKERKEKLKYTKQGKEHRKINSKIKLRNEREGTTTTQNRQGEDREHKKTTNVWIPLSGKCFLDDTNQSLSTTY